MTNVPKIALLGLLLMLGFILGSLALGFMLQHYNFVSQTLSEIGSASSPLQLPFQVFKVIIACGILLFAALLVRYAQSGELSVVPPIFVLAFGLADLGMALFPTPHPLHNVFGLSLTLGYLAPLVFALVWKNEPRRGFRQSSLIFFLLILLGIVLNLSPAFAPELYPLYYYGIVQRFLVYTMFIYFFYLGRSCR